MNRTKRIAVKELNAGSYRLSADERPIDFGHCREIFIDKYGEERGAKMYDDMIDMSGNSSARFFVVATQIQKEKKAMFWLLHSSNGTDMNGTFVDYSYEALYDKWQAMKRSLPLRLEGRFIGSANRRD